MRMLSTIRNLALQSEVVDWDAPDPNFTKFVYKITNKINGKYYIGQHTHRPRCGEVCDYVSGGTLILKAIKKYGIENFDKVILSWCLTQQELDKEEEDFIDLEDEMCYNLAKGGVGLKAGSKRSLESRVKQSISTRGEKNSNFGGKTRKPDTGAKISATLKKNDSRRGANNGSFGGCKSGCKCGRHFKSAETNQKISVSKKGKKFTEEHKNNISRARKKMLEEKN